MRCSKCGVENPDRAKFCVECTSLLAYKPPSSAWNAKPVTVLLGTATSSAPMGKSVSLKKQEKKLKKLKKQFKKAKKLARA